MPPGEEAKVAGTQKSVRTIFRRFARITGYLLKII
jgi:hypothetical protein